MSVQLTISTTVGGTTDPVPGRYTYPRNTRVTITAIPNTGYKWDHWNSDMFIPSENPVTFYVTENCYVTAVFVSTGPQYSNVTISKTGEGSTEPPIDNYPDTYEIGDNLSITATPATGWIYVKMKRNGVDWTSANPGVFLNLGQTENLEVVFEQEVPPNKGVLEIHAFKGSTEIDATVNVAGGTYHTPFSLELDPGNYPLTITYKGATKNYTVTIVAGQKTLKEYKYGTPPPDRRPIIIACVVILGIVGGAVLLKGRRKK